ncbi:DNA-binding protein [Paracandidimonas soli]|uniref:DNA-binding protein n=1 Tax=Paracandidimonas soli TaxID=1917182 RepID=UPI00104905BF|nr:DNA-binding protein [Paracandidimonas soli]
MIDSSNSVPTKPRLTVERVLRDALTDPRRRDAISTAAGWKDASSASSRVLSGQQGLQLDRLDAVLLAAGLTVVTPGYLDWLSKGAVMGANCWCERNSMGACGANW